MSEEDYAKLNELQNTIYTAMEIETIEQFKYGFALGLMMMKEVSELPICQN
jgi:hypothetical protein